MNNNKSNKAQMATPRKPSDEISASHRRAIALTLCKKWNAPHVTGFRFRRASSTSLHANRQDTARFIDVRIVAS